MKKLNNITLTTDDGRPLIDNVLKKELNLILLLKAMFNTVKYDSREDQRKADKVYNKLEEMQKVKNVKDFEVEDEEFEIVYKYAQKYEMFLRGRTFMPILDELERVKE